MEITDIHKAMEEQFLKYIKPIWEEEEKRTVRIGQITIVYSSKVE